jgi:CobQ-like glutamine amidotransferase family enzyme
MTRIRIEIGELVLHGFEYHDGRQVESAIVRELGRLVREDNSKMDDRVLSREISKVVAATSFNRNEHAYTRTKPA